MDIRRQVKPNVIKTMTLVIKVTRTQVKLTSPIHMPLILTKRSEKKGFKRANADFLSKFIFLKIR